MKRLHRWLATGVLASGLFAPGAAHAGDFNWHGAYVGPAADVLIALGTHTGIGSVVGQAGYNFTRGILVTGIRVQAGVEVVGTLGFAGEIASRTGVVVGHNAFYYVVSGLGVMAGSTYHSNGTGLELALGDRFSLYSDVRYLRFFGDPQPFVKLQFGVNWHLPDR